MGDVLSLGPGGARRPLHLVASAGAGQGRGHLARALTLAEVALGRGFSVSIELVAGTLDGVIGERVRRL